MSADIAELERVVEAYGKLLVGLFARDLGNGLLDPRKYRDLIDTSMPDMLPLRYSQRFEVPFLELADRFPPD